MKLFSLTVDFAFKALFARNPDLLMDLLNSFPAFQGTNQIKHLKILNPEIPKDLSDEKISILDILAENQIGEHFIVEMQAFPHKHFPRRILYYWAKVYTRGLKKGEEYEKLKRVYSINFVNFILWDKSKKYLSHFQVREVEEEFLLTEDLEIYIVELPKFTKGLEKVETNLESWCYLFKESNELGVEGMKVLEKKSSSMRKALNELKILSREPSARELYEIRRKAKLDKAAQLSYAYDKGLEEGIQKGIEQGIQKGIEQGLQKGRQEGIEQGLQKGIEQGLQKGIEQGLQKGIEQGLQKGIEQGLQKGIEQGIEGFYLGIQLNLELRFNLKNPPIMKLIRKIKDITQLKEILILSAKTKTLSDIEKKLKNKTQTKKK